MRQALFFALMVGMMVGNGAMAQEAPQPWKAPAWTDAKSVKLNGGYGLGLTSAVKRLKVAPLDDAGYVLADVALDRKRIFTEYSGDISGRYIGVGAFLATHFPEELAGLSQLAAGIVARQKPDGHFGADQNLPKLTRQTDMPILWGNGRMLVGLVELARQTGDAAALAAARKLGDYFIATNGVYCRPENLKSVGGTMADAFATCYFSCIEGLVELTSLTKDPKYLDEAKRIAELAIGSQSIDGFHSHGRMTTLRGVLEIYLSTGDKKWLEPVVREWQIIVSRYRLPTGGIKEVFDSTCLRDEGCSVSDWLRLNLLLWRATGQGVYLDEAERCLKNHFLWQQFANGGAGHRGMTHIDGQPVALQSGGADAYWCCCEHWPRGMVDVMRTAVTAGNDGVSVNLFVDVQASIPVQGVPWLVQATERPSSLDITVTTAAVSGIVSIHRPAWCKDASITAPAGLKVVEQPGQWLISGRWNGGQKKIVLRWEPQVRLERMAGGMDAFFAGHDILVAHPTQANGWMFESELKTVPVVRWNGSARIAEGMLRLAVKPSQGGQERTVELSHLARQARLFPHRAWWAFEADESGKQPALAAASADRGVYLGVAATTAARVWVNGSSVGDCRNVAETVERFVKTDGRAVVVVVCQAGSDQPARILADISFGSRLVRTGDDGWQAKALTEQEAKDIATLSDQGWLAAKVVDGWAGPVRENRMTRLEDMPGKWITGEASAGKPVLVFRCIVGQ